MPLVSPSLLSCDFANVQSECEMLNSSQADWFHLDVMDGVFVPNISYGIPIIKAINEHTLKPLDVHLMIVDPDKYIDTFKDAGANILTVHYEACDHLHRTLTAIREADMKAGVSLNPHTPVDFIKPIIQEIDLLLIMSVNPGFGGQSFIEETVEKVAQARKLLDDAGSKAVIEVDGGINMDTGKQVVDAGADVLVSGSFIFKSDDPAQTISDLRNL